MTHRHAFEAIDRSFRDLMGVDFPFGCKVMVLGGGFRQVLPVIPKGTKGKTHMLLSQHCGNVYKYSI